MRFLGGVFFKGLATVLPITITIAALHWLGTGTGELMKPVFEKLPFLPEGEAYRAWMGVGLAFAVIFVVGLLMNAYIVRVTFAWGERLLQKIPLVKTLYGSVRDLMGFFSGAEGKKVMGQVVMVRLGDTPLKLVGLVTREDFTDLPRGIGEEGSVAVYLPMSYQLGGFTTMVPRSLVEPIDMSVEQAMRFAVTAGMTAGGEPEPNARE